MGQKTNPLITRIDSKKNITKSNFYGKNSEESAYYLYQDLEMRKYLETILQAKGLIISECRIQRSNNSLNIFIDFYLISITITKWKYLINILKNAIIKSKLTKTKSITNYILKKKDINVNLFYIVESIISQNKFRKKKRLVTNENNSSLFFKLKKKLISKLETKKTTPIKNLNNILLHKKIIKTLFKFTNVSKINLRLNNLQNNQLLTQNHKELNIYSKKSFYKETLNIMNLIYNDKGSAELLCKYLILQFKTLKKHNLFLIFLKRVLQHFNKLDNTKIEGIKIIVNGRFNGAPRSRGKIIQYGKLPLQTIKTNIDYYYNQAYSVYGVFGIKVWICKKIKK